jgi:ribosome-associated protein
MIEVTPSIQIDENEISFDFIRSSGPGGQNVNKVATGVQLRFHVNDSPGLPEDVKARLLIIARNRINAGGELIIEAKSERTQEQNRAEALLRLAELVRQAAHPPKPRRATRPTAASRVRRLEQKRRRSQVKQERRSGRDLPQE